TDFDKLRFRAAGARSRGALEDAVRAGLFASEFGRGYYLGFIDQAPDFAAVSFVSETSPPAAVLVAAPAVPSGPGSESAFRPARLLIGGGLTAPVADVFDAAASVRVAAHPKEDRGFACSL